MKSLRILAAAALALGVTVTAANAGCEGRKTTGTVVGAAGGGLIGSAITHGSLGGVIGGAVVGGVAGHEIARSGCAPHRYYYKHGHRGYYDHNGRWHYG